MGWFTPECPIDREMKDWIEGSFQWLIEEFGADTIRNAMTVEASDEFFPDNFGGDVASVKSVLRRVCGHMGVEYATVELEFYDDEGPGDPHPLAMIEGSGSNACGLYEFRHNRHVISIGESLLKNPEKLIAKIAHELAHARLIGEDRLDDEEDDHEYLADLTTIFFGLGIFTANSLFMFEQFTNTNYQGWRQQRAGYIEEDTAGYALALYAYLRNETNPAWMNLVNRNVRYYMKKSLKFLEKTNDTSLSKL